jgi:hypothetical protein
MASSIDNLLTKISKGAVEAETGLPEIQDRSINGIYVKVKSLLLTVDEIVDTFTDLPGILFNWINQNKQRASRDLVGKVLFILRLIAQVEIRN